MTEMELHKLLIKRIRVRKVALHMNQRELAKRAGISEVALSRYMTGLRKPTYNFVVRIAQALECTPGDLLNVDEFVEW